VSVYSAPFSKTFNVKNERQEHVFDNEQHFMKCATCQQLFDMRDLKQVFEHEHDENLPELKHNYYGKNIDDDTHQASDR
jgi:hypothetical protein